MALVRKQDVLDWHPAALQVLHDLLRLDDGDVGIVRPVLNHQRRFDSIQLSERRQIAEEIRLRLRIAVLGRRDCRHPRLGMLEEREEVDHPEQVDAGREQVRVERDTDHRHIAAIGAAGDANTFRIGDAIADEIIDAVFQILDSLEPQRAVIEVHEALAES